MCGIVGITSTKQVSSTIINSLKKLEYRGYDSAGIATLNDGFINEVKCEGRVDGLEKNVSKINLLGNVGIGHVRWATHGIPNSINAHPHHDYSKKFSLIHNGIIENFSDLKKDLISDGYTFQSDTDTEVIANLIQKNFDQTSDIKQTMIDTVSNLSGHYAFVVIFEDGTLAAARFHEPLIVGVGKNSHYLSSDVLGFIERTDDAIYIDNEDFVIVDNNGLKIYNFDGSHVKHQITKVSKEFADVYKGDYAHYTLKEISEQPETILRAGDDEQINEIVKHIEDSKTLYITGSGTSYNSSRISKYLMSTHAKLKIEPIISSELQFAPDSIE